MNEQTTSEFQVLYDTVMDRKANPEEGSYTVYLFGKGKEKILKKVGEESTEVIIASLEEVEEELARRSEKKHNLKPERKPVTKY